MATTVPERRTKPEIGSCIEVRPGVWRLRVHRGARRYATETFHGTEGQAWWALDQLATTVHNERHDSGTVGELLERWFEMKSHELSPTTLQGYRRSIDHYLLPRFARVSVAELRGRDLDALYQDLLAGRGTRSGRRLNAKSVGQVHAVMRGALGQAVKWEMVPANAALAASPPSSKRHEIDPPDAALIRRALAALDDQPALLTLVLLAATTGARRGELCALRVSSFDLAERVVVMSQGVVDLPGRDPVVKSTKGGRVKRLALDERTTGVVFFYLWWRALRADRAGVTQVADPFLFSGDVAGERPWRPNWVTKQWDATRKAAGVPESVRLHDLRHAMATGMLGAGVDVRTVAGRLGHADPATTLRVYAHFLPARDRAAAEDYSAGF